MNAPEPEDEHHAYVQDTADRLSLPPHVAEPPILAKDHIAKERKALKVGKLGEQAVLVELGLADDNEEESDCAAPR